MKVLNKHISCLGLLAAILIMNACHKESPLIAPNNTNNTDSLLRIHIADSLLQIQIGHITDSAVGRYWCAHHSYSSSPYRNNFDTILGYDTVYVIKTAYNTIVVNGGSFTYGYVNVGPFIDTGFFNGNLYYYSSVTFRSHYDSINYVDNGFLSAGGSGDSYHLGGRIN